ncbi:NACHT domain-containing protein [Nonomuraea sp. NPDC049421]|uniref:NACHT domain-containing protein n=1 Tax=Nonomuraea sp. NPDC049421 TaxID=3155275 RepID=UPI003441F1DF
MALETAALKVGTAVGERAVRAWLTARSTGESSRLPLVELMRTHFPDQLVRRKARRQIDDIADAVTARVTKLCGHEFPGLGDDDRLVVLAEVTDALARADLSDRALFAADADPVRLARELRGALPASRDLGEAQARLYEVVLDECCDCLVRVVRHLPEFQPRAAAETLSRLTGLGDQLAAMLDRLPARTLLAPEGSDLDAAFRRRYLEHVARTLDNLELLGVRVERFRPRMSLSVAYISLSVSASRAASGLHAAWHDVPDEPAAMRVESALGQGRRILLRGEAGGGKSTLLRWLAITAAKSGFEGELAGWNGCVPFLVKLRSYADRELPRPEQFLDLTAGALAGLMPAGWAHRQLASGQALLLIDGVDELTGAQRRAIKPWLSGLLAEFPAVRVLVTSRPSAASASWLEEDGFAPAFLERMTPADTRALVEHWHEAIRSSADLPCPPEQLPVVRERLLSHLENAPHLRALAATPLLASMLCALSLDRTSQLPPDRMGLYAAALEMLLERRDAERVIPSYGEIHLNRAQKLQVLQELAWQLSVTNRVELPKPAARAWVDRVVATMPRVRADGGQVLDYLLARSGVLREPVEGRIDFVHRTVQEYLTARAAAEVGDVEPLVSNAHRDQWREVVVMAAGHANGPTRQALLDGLLSRITQEPRRARRLRILVCACLETLPSVPERLRKAVDKCLDDLIPPRDATAARSLSLAGQVVLDRLPRDLSGLSPAVARACATTAQMINGLDALNLLAGYAGDERVQYELVHSWRYFEPHTYAQRVLSAMKRPPHLYVSTTGQLEAVHALPSQRQMDIVVSAANDLNPLLTHRATLTDLFVHGPISEPGLSVLRQLSALTQLSVGGVDSLEFLTGLPHLSTLGLGKVPRISDFTPLASLTELRDLFILDAASLTAWERMPPLNRLRRLALYITPLVSSMRDVVERAPKLEFLSIGGQDHITGLDALSEVGIESLVFYRIPLLADLSPLAGCRSLRNLQLVRTAVEDLSPLAELPELQELWLAECPSGLDLAPLAGNTRLKVHLLGGQEAKNGELFGKRLYY